MKKIGKYYITIGLENHVALDTKEKLFSSTKNMFKNNHFSLFDAGMVGVLPVLSKEPVEMAVAFGLATNSKLNLLSKFDRKHYFYPDLTIGYQITQQFEPILTGGVIDIKDENGVDKKIIIEHTHLECDAAKSIHDKFKGSTSIDLSRGGSPLIEIVSTPCLKSVFEAKEYAKKLYELVSFMKICDGKIEEGSFRTDASISLSDDENKLGTRVEIKNISSFTHLSNALQYEIERQYDCLEDGIEIKNETRLYNEETGETESMRDKETVAQYKYMPDPNIPPLLIDKELINKVKDSFDVNYFDIVDEFNQTFTFFNVDFDINNLTKKYWDKKFIAIWEYIFKNKENLNQRDLKLMAFWICDSIKNKTISIDNFNELSKTKFTSETIKDILTQWDESNIDDIKSFFPEEIDLSPIKGITDTILKNNANKIEDYKNGDKKILNFLMGQCMKELKGKYKVDAQLIQSLILEKI